jgi:signal transduction histidine kinase
MNRLKEILSKSEKKGKKKLWSYVSLFSVSLALILLIAGSVIYYPMIANGMPLDSNRITTFLPIVAMAYGSLLLLVVAMIEGRMLLSRSGTLVLRNQTLDDLVEHLTKCQEEERERTSARLHDVVGNLVVALKMEIEDLCADSSDSEQYGRILDLLGKLMDEVRGISSLLYPRMIGTMGLRGAMEEMVDRLQSQSMKITLDMPESSVPLDKDESLCVLRVVQEAILNAIRHSNAGHIHCSILSEDGCLSGTIDDDGNGWEENAEGMGLTLMRERIRKVGGILCLEESPRRGARVRFETGGR